MCFLRYFLHNAKSNISSPFRELSIAWKACPCRGSTLRVLWRFEVLQTSNPLTQVAVSLGTIKSLPLRGISRGVGAPPPTPVHAKRVCKHSQAAKPPFGRSLPGTFHLLLKKQDKIRGVGTPPRTGTRKACTNAPRFACIGRLLCKHS